MPLVIGILIGIAAVVLLVAGGLWVLRQWLMPVRKVKVPPSGAAPWQRVRPTSLPGSMNSPGDRRQPFPTTDAFLPATRNSLPSRRGGLVSHELLWAKLAGNEADAAVLETNQVGSHPYERHARSRAILPRHNSQPMAPMRERESEKNAEEVP